MISAKSEPLFSRVGLEHGERNRFCVEKYGDITKAGWRVRMRNDFGYLSCDDYYEMLVEK